MADISLELAEIVAFILELITYGVFLVFFGVTLWAIFQKSHDRRINRSFLTTVVLLFAISTAHLAVSCVRIVDGFVGAAATPYGARAYFSDVRRPTHVVKATLFLVQTCVSDSFVVYRCFVVWARRWPVICLPLALLCATAASGIGLIYTLTKRATPGATVFLGALVPWVTSFFTLTLCTNVLCTALIAARIWRRARLAVQYSALRPFGVVVVESGAIYSGALLALLLVYASGSTGQYPALDYIMPLIGIAFSMIIVRINLGISATGCPRDAPRTEGLGVRGLNRGDYSIDLTRIVEQELMRDTTASIRESHASPAEGKLEEV
ncbi:hypothetical protein B0H10DRAFT_1992397 [Mycena sp. CBHHK59/15]|nr:hypothetical protein B0H10DRAFT_1992397 [Mycena sp. CBHHK59/15]